jgi:hypothetical protein
MPQERKILVASDSGIFIESAQDVLSALEACFGTAGLVLAERDLGPKFFDLRSGLAGELFQKFTNYRLRVAVVLPDPKAQGERFSELAHEHTSHQLIRFVGSTDEAVAWLRAE